MIIQPMCVECCVSLDNVEHYHLTGDDSGEWRCPRCQEQFEAKTEAEQINALELCLNDGTVARWAVPDEAIDKVEAAIKLILGEPDTIKM